MLARRFLVTGGLALALLAPAAARATTFGFDCITDNLAGDCAIGEAQLTVTVSDPGGGMVLFTFSNAGPEASAITQVYFDDGTLLGIAGLVDADQNALGSFGDPGVDFTAGSASPPVLPGGEEIGFVVTASFLADADPAVVPNGVGASESLGVVFDLQPGGSVADVLAELADGTLRIGIHVQGFASEGSESFVNVPEPSLAAFALPLLALLARGIRRES